MPRFPICSWWATGRPEQGEVSVRSRAGGDLGAMKVDDFAAMLREEIDTKSIK